MTATIQTSGKTYSEQQKQKALSLVLSGLSSREVEERTGVGASRVRGLKLDFYKKEKTAVSDVVAPVIDNEQTQTGEAKQEETPVSTPWRISVFVLLAFFIAIGHAGLVWYDMATLWAMPGKIGGGVVFAFILSGMVLMSDNSPKMKDIRENMLWAVGFLEALAVFVHRGAFYRQASAAYAAGMGIEYVWALSAVICLCSIGATIFYQKVIR